MAAPPSARRDRINPDFPKLVEMTHQYVYGDVWERPELSKRERSIVTIAALVALGWQDQLKSHIGRGLTNGLSRVEVAEIITPQVRRLSAQAVPHRLQVVGVQRLAHFGGHLLGDVARGALGRPDAVPGGHFVSGHTAFN